MLSPIKVKYLEITSSFQIYLGLFLTFFVSTLTNSNIVVIIWYANPK